MAEVIIEVSEFDVEEFVEEYGLTSYADSGVFDGFTNDAIRAVVGAMRIKYNGEDFKPVLRLVE